MSTFDFPRKPLRTLILSLGLATIAPLTHAFSGPGTVTLKSGKTTLNFAPQFFNIFPALGATLNDYGKSNFKGNLNKQNLRIKFPMTSATLNPSRPDYPNGFINIEHKGGLLMENPGTGMNVILNSPGLHASDNCWASAQCVGMNAVVVKNGTVIGNVPNIAQNTYMLDSFPIKNGGIKLKNLSMALTKQGANLMNEFFGLKPGDSLLLKEGSAFGTFDVSGKGVKVTCPPGFTYVKKNQECK